MNSDQGNAATARARRDTLTWSAAVPILSHPVILKNAAFQLCWAWGLMTLVIIVTQAFYGSSLSPAQVVAAASLSARFAGVLAGLFLVICLGPLSNRYVAHFTASGAGIACQSIRVRRRDWAGTPFFARRSFPAPSGYGELRHVRRQVDWDRITRVRPVGTSRTIVLSRGPFTLMRLHCPDGESYRKVLDFVNEHTGGEGSSLKG